MLARMANTLFHRGPDDDGYFESDGVALANRRLSIIGLADGKQPLHNENNTVHVVMNGELFDYIEQRDSNQMIATVVNVFCLLFAVILALIAMANVFNTVTNSLILRRREFAVMKSVGLSNRQFRAMVAEECVAWCVRGLVPGVLLSLFVSFLLTRLCLYVSTSLERTGSGYLLAGLIAMRFSEKR